MTTNAEIKEVVIPTTKVHKIIKASGIGRCSKESASVFAEYLTNELIMLAKKAEEFSSHAGRKTINLSDAELAVKEFGKIVKEE